MPMFGGFLADKFIGYQCSVMFGGLVMTVGHFILALPNDWSFFYGMALIICGNGFFKPNISSLVGTLPVFASIRTYLLIYGGTLLVVPIVVTLFNQYYLMDYIMFGLGIVALIYIVSVGIKMERTAKFKLFAALVMIIFSILFWAIYEQNAGSMNLLAERNSKMVLFGVELPALAINNFFRRAGWYY